MMISPSSPSILKNSNKFYDFFETQINHIVNSNNISLEPGIEYDFELNIDDFSLLVVGFQEKITQSITDPQLAKKIAISDR